MTGVQSLNANAEVMGRQAALFMNINAAKGLEDVMKTNLGPKGTIKMLVSGAGGESMAVRPAACANAQLIYLAGTREVDSSSASAQRPQQSSVLQEYGCSRFPVRSMVQFTCSLAWKQPLAPSRSVAVCGLAFTSCNTTLLLRC
jgi:hypothetical protein